MYKRQRLLSAGKYFILRPYGGADFGLTESLRLFGEVGFNFGSYPPTAFDIDPATLGVEDLAMHGLYLQTGLSFQLDI